MALPYPDSPCLCAGGTYDVAAGLGWASSTGRHVTMSTPQQPELRRSGRGATDPASAKGKAETTTSDDDAPGPVPVDNMPGHHPDKEQDKPEETQR